MSIFQSVSLFVRFNLFSEYKRKYIYQLLFIVNINLLFRKLPTFIINYSRRSLVPKAINIQEVTELFALSRSRWLFNYANWLQCTLWSVDYDCGFFTHSLNSQSLHVQYNCLDTRYCLFRMQVKLKNLWLNTWTWTRWTRDTID